MLPSGHRFQRSSIKIEERVVVVMSFLLVQTVLQADIIVRCKYF